jgi:hypothetical protein
MFKYIKQTPWLFILTIGLFGWLLFFIVTHAKSNNMKRNKTNLHHIVEADHS